MDRITELLGRITDLSTEELVELQELIVSEFEAVSEQDLTREVAEQMSSLGSAAEALRSEGSRREAESAELAATRDSVAALINGSPDASKDDEDAPDEEDEDADKKKAKEKESEKELPDPSAELSVATEETVSVSETPETVTEIETTPAVTNFTNVTVDVDAIAKAVVAELASVSASEAELATADGEPEVFDSATDEVEVEVEAEEVPEVVVEEEIPALEVVEEVPAVEEVEEVEPVVSEEEVDVQEEFTSEVPNTEEDSEETVTAAANTDGLEIEVPSDRRPLEIKSEKAPVTITAGADIPGFAPGSELPNLRAVAQGLLDRKRGMGRTSGGDGEQHLVASFSTTFPEARTLVSNDFDGNSTKISNVISEPALVAAGGLCAPVEVSYDIFGLGELGRPVRDSLAVFSADRGGIRFVTPPTLSYLDGAVSLWTLQDDIDAASPEAPNPVKPCIRVACGTEVTVYTDAIPLCLVFGNLGARAYPELVERHIELGMISHARYAETRLLTRIGALSTAVTSASQLGAARDIFVAVEQAAAGYRNRHRMSPDARLRVIFPEWFKNALRADLTKQIPGDGDATTFALAEATINSWFAIRGIEVTWTLDGESGQILGSQAAGALNSFPTDVVWYLFAEGTFLFLDGGTLDLGIVRDSTLNGTNDYKIFLETFEGLAKVGIESLKVTTQLRIAGASASTVNTIS